MGGVGVRYNSGTKMGVKTIEIDDERVFWIKQKALKLSALVMFCDGW